jgi:hypothetical protein
MPEIRPQLLSLLALLSFEAKAHSNKPLVTCASLLEQISLKLSPNEKAISIATSPYDIYYETLEKKAERPSKHGGSQILLERFGEAWFSLFTSTPMDFDPQGDPRTFITSVGSDIAAYFSFDLVDTHTLWAPDGMEFQKSIEKLNEKHHDIQGRPLINVSFYPAGDDLTLREYLERFIQDHALPFAMEGNPQMHDLSFHTGAIFLSPEILSQMNPALQDALALMNFVREKIKLSKGSKKIQWKDLLSLIKTRYATLIDELTGTVSTFIAAYANGGDVEQYHRLIRKMLAKNLYPLALKGIQTGESDDSKEWIRFDRLALLGEMAASDEDLDEISSELKLWLEQQSLALKGKHKVEINIEAFCLSIQKMRLEIIQFIRSEML